MPNSQNAAIFRGMLHFGKVNSRFFFRAHRTNDLTRKLEKVGPFECDELEKHCRVSAKCYPTRVPALYTMTKEKFKSVFLVLLLVSRQTKSQLLRIHKLVPIKYNVRATNRRGRESTELRGKPVAGYPPPNGSNLPILPRGGGGGEGGSTYIPSTYIPYQNA